MENEIVLFKLMNVIVYLIVISLSIIAGILVYTGLSTKAERQNYRIRLSSRIEKSRNKLIEGSKHSKAEDQLRRAQYPLGLNGLRYYLLIGCIYGFLIIYYVLIPLLLEGTITQTSYISGIVILILILFSLPSFPFSIFNFVMKRVVNFQQAKVHSEVFMLYDLLINEIEMMTVNRINTYNVLRSMKPYFIYLEQPLTRLLSTWTSDLGSDTALDNFLMEIDSKESAALIGVIKNLDGMDRQTALQQLRGMHQMFVKNQIENYRRKTKITNDVLNIPVKVTHFLIILNFLVLIVSMVTLILQQTRG
ncbi:hypothetical protein M3612_20000 [Niallia taxi]|uniref:hypothetical protein n=1 Tax=Niallia taxi TaxID=2499688 RepID=UPI00203A87B4|nr:hypothetical protein [Niallia taxi]MCM3216772.1 hypothetical protein [Niallia taxi]